MSNKSAMRTHLRSNRGNPGGSGEESQRPTRGNPSGGSEEEAMRALQSLKRTGLPDYWAMVEDPPYIAQWHRRSTGNHVNGDGLMVERAVPWRPRTGLALGGTHPQGACIDGVRKHRHTSSCEWAVVCRGRRLSTR